VTNETVKLSLSVILGSISLIIGSGCCLVKSQQRVEPLYPQHVSGWMKKDEREAFTKKYGFWSRGEFVVKKGEAIDEFN
jgi:hypothetical protein